MQVLVFVTDNGTADGTGPVLFLKDDPLSVLPANPRSLEWRYFATIGAQDQMIAVEGERALNRLNEDGFYISNRLV